MSRVLVTTAIEETWPNGEPILFLGEWCRRFSRRERWSRLDTKVVNYHWDNRSRLAADFRYLDGFHEKLLEDLASDLNELHGTDHSLRYWRILIGPWLGYFVAILRDRWLSIEEAVDHHDISWTRVLKFRELDLVPRTFDDFSTLYILDEWNHYIYSMVLEKFSQVDICREAGYDLPFPTTVAVHPNNRVGVKTLLWQMFSRLFAQFVRKDDIVLFGTYLSFRKEVVLSLQLHQSPVIWHLIPRPDLQVEAARTHWTMSGTPTDNFEEFVREMIPRQIPRAYSDGYCNLQTAVEEMLLPANPRLIFTSNAHISDDLFKAWAALKVENGARLAIGQHGGCHGALRHFFIEDHQLRISDAFLSWGWKDSANSRIKPVGQLIARKHSRSVHAEQETALLVGNSDPRQSHHLYSCPISSQWLSWLEDQFKFVEALPEHIRSALLVRLYREDYGWDQVKRWQDRCPDVRLDDAQGPSTMADLLPQARVMIATRNATTFLESFTMDVPTIIFWNPNHWELRETATPVFESLIEAEILHYSPISAANKLSNIWNDVDSWWSSEPITIARKGFCNSYNQSPPDLVSRVTHALKETIREPLCE